MSFFLVFLWSLGFLFAFSRSSMVFSHFYGFLPPPKGCLAVRLFAIEKHQKPALGVLIGEFSAYFSLKCFFIGYDMGFPASIGSKVVFVF